MTGFEVIQADITTLDVDAIVNAANGQLLPGGGVCGAIHRVAGPELAEACASLAPCPTGEVRVTPGFRLPARFVIHAVGPVWQSGAAGEDRQLAACYRAAIAEAARLGAASIAFPAISTGIYGYPPEQAAPDSTPPRDSRPAAGTPGPPGRTSTASPPRPASSPAPP